MTTPISSQDYAALNAAFAEKVAGWTTREDGLWLDGGCPVDVEGYPLVPRFTTSADAVLPWLSRLIRYDLYWSNGASGPSCRITAWDDNDDDHFAMAPTFPKAAVIALLRAHGVDVTD